MKSEGKSFFCVAFAACSIFVLQAVAGAGLIAACEPTSENGSVFQVCCNAAASDYLSEKPLSLNELQNRMNLASELIAGWLFPDETEMKYLMEDVNLFIVPDVETESLVGSGFTDAFQLKFVAN